MSRDPETSHQIIPFRRRLSVRIFGVGVLLMVLPSTALFYTGYSSLEGVMRRSVQEQVDRSVTTASQRLNTFFDGFLRLSSRMAQNEFLASALKPGPDLVRRSAEVDRVLDTETGFFPYAGELFFTLKDSQGQLFSNWSRNLISYDSLEDLPLVKKARQSEGFTVWESFSRPYIREERKPNNTFISLARMLPNPLAEPPALLLMSFRTQLLSRILAEVSPGAGTVLILCDSQGKEFLSTSGPTMEKRSLKELLTRPSGAVVGNSIMIREQLRSIPGDLAGAGMVLLALYPYDTLTDTFRALLVSFSLIFFLLTLTSTLLAFFVSRRVILPIGRLAAEMRQWELGRPLPPTLSNPGEDEVGSLQKAFVTMQEKIDELFAAVEREHKIREHYRFVSQQAQLNPHFLFNSLNTLRFMAILNKSKNMIEAIDAIGTVLQHSIGRETTHTTVGEEIRSLESLVKVYNLRFGDAFVLEVVYEGASRSHLESQRILRFILYPAVENALLHGYAEHSGSGVVRVRVSETAAALILTVQDWGMGIEPEKLSGIFEETYREQGIGLYNIREMVRQVYGAEGNVRVESQPKQGTLVTFELPWKQESSL